MKGIKRKRVVLILLGVLALIAISPVLFRQINLSPSATSTWKNAPTTITWEYYPPCQLSNRNYLYPRPQGGVFALNHGGELYAFDDTGGLVRPMVALPGEKFTGGVVDSAGNLYAGTRSSRVYAFDPGGKQLWVCEIPRRQAAAPDPKLDYVLPAVGPDGEIYAAVSRGEVAVIAEDGEISRHLDVGTKLALRGAPLPMLDGGFCLAAQGSMVIRIDPDGQELWRHSAPGNVITQFAAGLDGTLYFTVFQAHFYALNLDGTLRWQYTNPDPPPVNSHHTYNFCQDETGNVIILVGRRILAFSPAGTRLWSRKVEGQGMQPFVAGDRIIAQFSVLTAEMWLSRQASSFSAKTGVPITTGSTDWCPVILQVFDTATGKTTQSRETPVLVLLEGGPGSQGELYGTRLIPQTGNSIPHASILRVDVN